MTNKSSYYDQDRQHSTVVKKSGFGVRRSGFPFTFTGCVRPYVSHTTCVCFLFCKNGDKNTHCTRLLGQCFSNDLWYKTSFCNFESLPGHYIALPCMTNKQLPVPANHFTSATQTGLYLLGCCNNVNICYVSSHLTSVVISLQTTNSLQTPLVCRSPSEQSCSTAVVLTQGDFNPSGHSQCPEIFGSPKLGMGCATDIQWVKAGDAAEDITLLRIVSPLSPARQ